MAERSERTANFSLGVSLLSLIVACAALYLVADGRFDFFAPRKPTTSIASPVQQNSWLPAAPPAPFVDGGNSPDTDSYPPELDASEPLATGESTNIPFSNRGLRDALIQSVEFKVEKCYETPARLKNYRVWPVISIPFSLAAYDPRTGILRYDLPVPMRIARADATTVDPWMILEASLVSPEHQGWTYSGTATIHFTNAKPLSINHVELDLVSKAPAH